MVPYVLATLKRMLGISSSASLSSMGRMDLAMTSMVTTGDRVYEIEIDVSKTRRGREKKKASIGIRCGAHHAGSALLTDIAKQVVMR